MLQSLEIKNFRILRDFSASGLARVNLIVGKNNGGKSSILEALRIYAAVGHHLILEMLAQGHDERTAFDKAGDWLIEPELWPYAGFFSTPGIAGQEIEIGEGDTKLRLELGWMSQDKVFSPFAQTPSGNVDVQPVLRISFAQQQVLYPVDQELRSKVWLFLIKGGMPCAFIPTSLLDQNRLALEWDAIGLTDQKQIVRAALQIIAPEFEDLMFVQQAQGRRAMVRLRGSKHPQPLSSMGEGMQRVLQLVLQALAAKGGLLLIDEFENGLHYSVQAQVWELLFKLATELDLQIFATTHSWDCVQSFARIAHAGGDGALLRVGQSVRTSNKGQVVANVFDATQLLALTQAEMEVR